MKLPRELLQDLRAGNTILFAGAGVSQNLRLPSWDELISHLARKSGFDPAIFKVLGNHDPLALAEFYKIEKGSIQPLLKWMDREWHRSDIKIKSSRIHQLIVKLDFPIIYTTNYDRWLEKAFECWKRKYVKIANVGDLQKETRGATQIVKFHGDFDDDASIVLTESDYFRRLSFEDALDIKLRSDVISKGILFIGYGLRDINIRYLLFKLQTIWDAYKGDNPRRQSYIFLRQPNRIQERVLEKRGVKPIISPVENAGEGLQIFLERLYSAL